MATKGSIVCLDAQPAKGCSHTLLQLLFDLVCTAVSDVFGDRPGLTGVLTGSSQS